MGSSTLIRLYFEGHYSLVQKSAILTGLSMGARECAQLAPAIESKQAKVDFPSKYLPQPLHARYASPADRQLLEANKMIETTTGLIANEALRRGRGSAEDRVPEYARQKQLRVKGAFTRGKVVDMDDGTFEVDQATIKVPPPKIAFKDIAAEYFILPMINRFLTYLQEETMREAQTHGRYTVGGTGMILSSLSVSQFLSTLAIMVHAARHSALYLSVICPEALELAVSVGSKLSIAPTFSPSSKINKDKDFEADVVGTALELALVSVDAAKELDGGRSLALDKSAVLMASAEWASDILQRENQGESTTSNTRGIKEGRVKKAAAGLLVLVTGIVEKMQGLLT
jgi:telomere length regulation protein